MIKAFNLALVVQLKVVFGGGGMEKFDGNGMTVKEDQVENLAQKGWKCNEIRMQGQLILVLTASYN